MPYQYKVEYSRSGRSTCRECKKVISSGTLRIGISHTEHNPFHSKEPIVQWYHFQHGIAAIKRKRDKSVVPTRLSNFSGYRYLSAKDQDRVEKVIDSIRSSRAATSRTRTRARSRVKTASRSRTKRQTSRSKTTTRSSSKRKRSTSRRRSLSKSKTRTASRRNRRSDCSRSRSRSPRRRRSSRRARSRS